MGYFKVLLLLALVQFVISQDASLLQPCKSTDIECLNKSTERFLQNTHKGVPEYGIKPIDPLIIDSVEYTPCEEFGLVMQFKNVNITGLKNQIITEFIMDKDKKSVSLTTKTNLHIEADGTSDFRKESKKFSGHYSASAEVLGTLKYSYSLTVDDKGVEHFEVGPYTSSCKIEGQPKTTSSARKDIFADPILKAKLEANPEHNAELLNRVLCNFVKLGYEDVLHNIGASAKILPKTAFFTDI